MGFPEFVEWKVKSKHTRQIDFITDNNGKNIVDFVGRYESLEKDLKKIQEHLKLNRCNIPHKNRSLGRDRRNYTYYYDYGTRKLVEEYYREDLRVLDYSF